MTKNHDGCLEFFSNLRYFTLPRTIRQKIRIQVGALKDGCEIIVSKDANRSLWMTRSILLLLIAAVSIPQLLGYSNDLFLIAFIILVGYLFFHLLKSPEFSVGAFCNSLFEDVSRKEGIIFREVYLNQEVGVSNLLIPGVIAVMLVVFVLQLKGFSSVIIVTLGAIAPLFFRSFRSIFAFIAIPYVVLLYLLFVRFLGLFFQQIDATATTPNVAYLFLLVVNSFFVVFLGWALRQYLRNVGQDHFTTRHLEKFKIDQRRKMLIGFVFAITHFYLWGYYAAFEWRLFQGSMPMSLKALLVLTTLVPVVYVIFIFCENLRQVLQSTNLQKQSAEFDEFFAYRGNKSNKESAYLRIPLLPYKKPILTVQGAPSLIVLKHELAHIKLGHIRCLKWLNFASRWLLLGEGFFSLLYYRPSQIEDEADSYSDMEVIPELENLPVLEHKSSPSSNAFLRSLKYEYYQKWYLYHSRSYE